MSEPRLGSATRELLRAAKADGPSAAARAKVWGNVAGSVGAAGAGAAGAAAAGGSLAPGGAAVGAVAASKMLAIGTLLGGTITVGLAAALLHIGAAPSPAPPSAAGMTHVAQAAPIAPLAGNATASDRTDPSLLEPPPLTPSTPPVAVSHAATWVARVTPAPSPSTHLYPPVADDGLAREAVLVAEARGAMKRGDPQACLRSVHAARLLASHQLGPEELALEAQAFRALGRDEEAADSDAQLRKQFPESALSR